MKSTIKTVFLTALLCVLCFARSNLSGAELVPLLETDSSFPSGLLLVEKDGKFGYINSTGQEVIPPQYDDADQFTPYGLAAVCVDGKWGVIDSTGAQILPAAYQEVRLLGDDTLFSVMEDDRSRIIDRDGEIVIPPVLHGASPIRMPGAILYQQEGDKYGFLFDGSVVMPPEYEQNYFYFEDSDLLAVCKDGQWLYLNCQGQTVLETQCVLDPSSVSGPFVLAANPEGETVLLDSRGEQLSLTQRDIRFIYPYDFPAELDWGYYAPAEGYAIAGNSDGKYGIVDSTAHYVIAPEYDTLVLGPELVYAMQDGRAFLLDPSGETVTPAPAGCDADHCARFVSSKTLLPIYDADSACYGFTDRDGNVVLDPQFISITAFSDGVCIVSSRQGTGILKDDGTYLVDPIADCFLDDITRIGTAFLVHCGTSTAGGPWDPPALSTGYDLLLDAEGKTIATLDDASGLHLAESLSADSVYLPVTNGAGLTGLMDSRTGALLLEPKYDAIYSGRPRHGFGQTWYTAKTFPLE